MIPLTLFQFVKSIPGIEWLKQQLIQLKLYEERLGELEGAVDVLKKELESVINIVNEEENQYGKVRTAKVKAWIEGVDVIISEYNEFIEDKCLDELAVLNFFTTGYLPKPGIRYCRSRRAYNIITKVNVKKNTAEFDKYAEGSGPPSKASFLLTDNYENFPSRDEIVKKLKEALGNPDVKMIGLYGLKGVGKSTMVKELAKEVEVNQNFVMTMANLEGNPGIRQTQGEIAGWLGITLVHESDSARATQLEDHLKKKKKNTLVILDHLCANLDFKLLGIPSLNDNLNNVEKGKPSGQHSMVEIEETILDCYKMCKVLLISESKQLLSQMGVNETNIFTMDVLKDEEAEMFFKKKAGVGNGESEFNILAAQIANKCNGLPSSLVESAKGLVNQKSLSAWTNALENLERQMSTGVPEFSTKLSFELLDEELKNIFLLCAYMGPDLLIMELVKHCIGLDYLQGTYKESDPRDKVRELVRKLKLVGLLSDNHSSDHVTMQAIVRSAALSIASDTKEKHIFTMTKEPFHKWPNEDKLNKLAVISLRHCDICDGFLKRINCPRLRVFRVDNNNPLLEIPTNFFEGMKELRVLILTGIHLSPSDSSIATLNKLRMLCLEQCILDKDLSFIGNLKELIILSFSGSDIEKLPVELKQVKKLQVFDISNCCKLKEIPPNVISSLSDLKELYMRNTFIQWKPIGQTHPDGIACLSEFRRLIHNQLTTLDIQIPVVSCVPKDLFFNKLNRYKIVVGDVNAYFETDSNMPEKYEASRYLAIQLKSGFDIHFQEGIKGLFGEVENLFIEELNGVQDIFYNLNWKGFLSLKHLLIVNNSEIQSLINPKDTQHSKNIFPKLESLHLYNLKNIDEICSCKLSAPSFANLKVIKINLCAKLNKVFLFSVISLLTVLETIEVSKCNTLKEIVALEAQSNPTEIKFLNFPELRSLTLLSLPGLIGFNHIPSTGKKATELFHEKVAVPKLEKMVLSSIQIGKIWCDQPSQCFQNLIHLDVNGCWNLEYLISFSMAESLVHLESLSVSECVQMTNIFDPQGQESRAKIKDCIFPNLKNIKLSSLNSLMEIWNSGLPSNSFGKLDALVIEECDKFDKVFPCYMAGIFKSLQVLRVTNCKSMTAIFDLDDKRGDAGDVVNLRDVHLETLPKLEDVWKWNKDQDRILKLNYIQNMWVSDCHGLENIFPFSEAKNLNKLEYLVVRDCSNLREIVVNGQGTNTASTSSPNISFVFPKLTTINFSKLPKLKSFYRGCYELSCPALINLSIELCDKVELFCKGTTDENPVLYPEEVINKLKSMQIDGEPSSSYTGKGNYQGKNFEELHLCRLKNTDMLYSFLYSSPDLKSLSLIECFFEEIVPLERPREHQNAGVVPNLKSLKLIDLPNLENIGFERGAFIQKIELLILKNCPSLVNMIPSSLSDTFLTHLEVVNCNGLKTLMPLSSAKSMGKLRTIKIIKCESLQEIVENEDEDRNVVFKQLKVLELVSLTSLKSFCSSKTCVFVFPSLEKLVVSACPKMESFCDVKITPLLQKIHVVPENENRWCWKYNLNATIKYIFKEKKFFEGMDEINVSEHLELQECQYGNPFQQSNWFYSLKTLKLKNCNNQSCAIPSNILLTCLKSLNELDVRDCQRLEVIFNFSDAEIMGSTSQLKKLTLENLPRLTHVWKKNLQVSHNFENLQQVIVKNCENLESLFPVALAENLLNLEKLEIGFCYKMLAIVGKQTSGKEVTKKFVYPCLTILTLTWLSNLTFFYPGSFTLECPALYNLSVFYCLKLKLFQSEHLEGDTEGSSTSIYKHPVISDLRDIPSLMVLSVDWKDASALWFRLFTENLPYLDTLFLNLYDLNSDNKQPGFLFEILEKTLNVKKLYLYYCSRPEVLLNQNPNIGEEMMLGHLEMLSLNHITNLKFVGSEGSSFLNTICERLHQLIVSNCPDLTILLVHPVSAVSFSCLKELDITKCHGLNYLFTSSLAMKLTHLEKIKVKNCNTMTRIVERDNTLERLKLEQLSCIVLSSLSSLECFYSGSETLQLPSLAQVNIMDCPQLKIFSQGSIDAESINSIKIDGDLISYDDLDVCVEMKFLQQVEIDLLVLGDSLLFQKIWLRSVAVPDSFLCNLTSLIVEGCGFLSNAIIPSHLLHSLSNLEKLQVRKCNHAKAIFDETKMNNMGPASNPLSFRIKILILEQLPILEHIWNHGPQGSLSLPLLKKVIVDGCKEMKYLFPASEVNMDQLETLHVKNCDMLVEIWNEVQKRSLSLPLLEEVIVDGCKGIKYLFPASEVKLDQLETLHVKNCDMLVEIWNEVQKGSLSLPLLEKVIVDGCTGLKSLFPASEVKMVRLKTLHVKNCDMLVEIVAKEQNEKIFSSVTSLKLWNLPNLWWMYSGMDILKWPKLEELDILRCQNIFRTNLSLAKVTPSLKLLSFGKEEFTMINEKKLDVSCVELYSLKLQYFSDDKSDVFEFLSDSWKPLSMENLVVVYSAFKEIFSSLPKFNQSYRLRSHFLSKLRGLELQNLQRLVSIGFEQSWMKPFVEKLETIFVKECHCLTNLTPSDKQVSFSHLTELKVEDCCRLEYLFSSSTAKTLQVLKKMHVSNCESVQNIVATEDENSITFRQLQLLSLKLLPKLESFYSGSSKLNFPSLNEVSITECHNMEVFCSGEAITEWLTLTIDGVYMRGDLNDVIKKRFDAW